MPIITTKVNVRKIAAAPNVAARTTRERRLQTIGVTTTLDDAADARAGLTRTTEQLLGGWALVLGSRRLRG